ncbi:hypothetical protein CPB83DRAFT_832943 [Crepidotus variabilis]|uniref:Uncharacterized protein n=1 Tax=Crepidotus variabilis TaxID=179855 RepID=A0A9P6ENX1_9AGAR|nr:hypothetical protein CPB83DRAFT_832943 [Crepidotus variabilis]
MIQRGFTQGKYIFGKDVSLRVKWMGDFSSRIHLVAGKGSCAPVAVFDLITEISPTTNPAEIPAPYWLKFVIGHKHPGPDRSQPMIALIGAISFMQFSRSETPPADIPCPRAIPLARKTSLFSHGHPPLPYGSFHHPHEAWGGVEEERIGGFGLLVSEKPVFFTNGKNVAQKVADHRSVPSHVHHRPTLRRKQTFDDESIQGLTGQFRGKSFWLGQLTQQSQRFDSK